MVFRVQFLESLHNFVETWSRNVSVKSSVKVPVPSLGVSVPAVAHELGVLGRAPSWDGRALALVADHKNNLKSRHSFIRIFTSPKFPKTNSKTVHIGFLSIMRIFQYLKKNMRMVTMKATITSGAAHAGVPHDVIVPLICSTTLLSPKSLI